MLPGDVISPTADVWEIPEAEWALDFDQTDALTKFRAATGERWTVRRFKADSIPWWSIEHGETAPTGVVTIIDLTLRKALRLAEQSEKGRQT